MNPDSQDPETPTDGHQAAGAALRLVLLPGMDGTGDLFARFTARTPPGFETQVVGFPTDVRMGYEALAGAVREQLPTSGRFVLLGESFSGPLALRLAAARTRGLAAVILSASFVRGPVAAQRLAWLGGLVGRRAMPAWVLARVLTGDDPDLADELRHAMRRVQGAVLGNRLAAIAHVDAREHLKRCPVPVLVLRAAADRLLGPGAVEEIVACRPDVVVRDVEAPHLLLQAAPEAAWSAITAFLG